MHDDNICIIIGYYIQTCITNDAVNVNRILWNAATVNKKQKYIFKMRRILI